MNMVGASRGSTKKERKPVKQKNNKNEMNRRLLEILVRETVMETARTSNAGRKSPGDASLQKEQTDYSQDMLYKAFIEPFTDIWKTAQHGAEKVMATAGGELGILAKQLAFLLVPFIKPEAGSLSAMAAQDRQKMAGRLSHIDDKFKDVLDRNWQAFNNPDVWGTLFLLHPQLAIGQKIASKAPEVALELLSVLTGGSEAVESILKSYRNMRTGGGRVAYAQHQTDYSQSSGGYGDYGGDYGAFQEQVAAPAAPAQQQQQQKPPTDPNTWARQQIAVLLKDPNIKKQISSSKVGRAMQGEAIGYILQAAKKDLGFDFSQLKAKAGSNFPKILSELEKKLGKEAVSKIETDQNLQKKVVADIKGMLKPAYIKQLQSLVHINPAASGMVNKAIQQIQAL